MRKLVEKYHEFMGRNLPPRDLVIKFSVPLPGDKVRRPKLSDLRPPRGLHELLDDREVLRAFVVNLQQLNQCKLRPGRRMAYTEKVAWRFMPLALRQVRQFAHDGAVPDTQERREVLDLVAQICQRLLESYRSVFKSWYKVSNFRFARAQRAFDVCAYRILDVSRFWQRVLALRYRVLPESAWLSVNLVFHVMHAHGKADLSCHAFEEIYVERPHQHSLQDLYLAIQMIARLDVLRWPTEWHFTLDSYARIVNALVMLEEDDRNMLRADYSIAYCYDDCAARSMRIPGQSTRGKALLINWRKLRSKLVRDFARNLEHQSQRIDEKAFALLSFADGLALLELQGNCWLTHPYPLPSREQRGQECDVRMFVGFKSIYPFLFNLHYGAGAGEEIGKRMVDLLAQRSALFAEDHTATTDSVWMLLEQDDKRIVLRTQETDFTVSMRIGALAAYGFGEAGLRSSALGCIARLYRPAADAVVVEILKLGLQSEPVLLVPDLSNFEQFDQNHKEVGYAVLAVNPGNGQDAPECRLLLPAHSPLLEGHQVVMKRVGLRQVILLGRLQSATKTYRSYIYTVQKSMQAK